MALKNKETGAYLRVDLDGNYLIYKSEEARKFEKKKISSAYIIWKYNDIINKLECDSERRYYDPSYYSEYDAWYDEYYKYRDALRKGITTNKYPLMKKHFKNIEKTIISVIERGWMRVEGETLKEVYKNLKSKEGFKEMEDC